MNGKDLVKQAFSLHKTERTPWVPFVGVHGGKLIGVSATDFLKSANNIVLGVSKAIELYKPDGIPVAFDLQIETEILGCNLVWADENPPSVVSHPLLERKQLADLKLPTINDGRLPVVLEVARKPLR